MKILDFLTLSLSFVTCSIAGCAATVLGGGTGGAPPTTSIVSTSTSSGVPAIGLCAGATRVTVGGSVKGSTCGGTHVGDNGICQYPGRPDAFIYVDAPDGQAFTVEAPPGYSIMEYVACDSEFPLSCAFGGGGGPVSFTPEALTTHLFEIERVDANCGEFTVSVSPSSGGTSTAASSSSSSGVPFTTSASSSSGVSSTTSSSSSSTGGTPTGHCVGATHVPVGGSFTGSTCGGTPDGSGHTCGYPGNPDVFIYVDDTPDSGTYSVKSSPGYSIMAYDACDSDTSLVCAFGGGAGADLTFTSGTHLYAIERVDANCGAFTVSIIAN
jgi:hypothetical protein